MFFPDASLCVCVIFSSKSETTLELTSTVTSSQRPFIGHFISSCFYIREVSVDSCGADLFILNMGLSSISPREYITKLEMLFL